MAKLICVFGISGVGKTHFVKNLIARKSSLRRVSGGDLISEGQRSASTDRDALTGIATDAILANQQFIVFGIQQLRSKEARDLIFDGHSVVRSDEGLFEVPLEIIEALQPVGIVFVRDDENKILERRRWDISRRRSDISSAEIESEQHRAHAAALYYSTQLAIPISIIMSGETEEFEKTVERFLSLI